MEYLERRWRMRHENELDEIEAHPVVPDDLDMIHAAATGKKCICGSDIVMERCPECNETILGCMSCHLEEHDNVLMAS